MSVLYIIAGVNHFIHPHFYLKIMPPWLPLHSLLVLLSGIMEAVFGILLFIPAARVFAAWGLIALLIAVFPANVQMILNYRQQHNPSLVVNCFAFAFAGVIDSMGLRLHKIIKARSCPQSPSF